MKKTNKNNKCSGRKTEYALWGTRNGTEDVIRVNGDEVQENLSTAQKIKSLLLKRGDFKKIRIQKIDFRDCDLKSAFIRGIVRKKE